jgi:hypothetical protein
MSQAALKRTILPVLATILILPVGSGTLAQERIVAIGDVHGDLRATRNALRLAGAIDSLDTWIGGSLVVVQTGDQLDRGDEEQAILDWFQKLQGEAAAAGGAFLPLLGNHELMNVHADLRYVTPGGFADFEDAVTVDAQDPELAAFEPHQRARMAAFLPGRPYARLLAEHQLILQRGDNVFVHGGVLPHHVAYGIDRINAETQAWLRGDIDRPRILKEDSPQWSRLYSDEPDSTACATLARTLELLGAKRMIVGHTVQESGISSYCGGRVWCIDVGLAAHYGGELQVLEIHGDDVRVLPQD